MPNPEATRHANSQTRGRRVADIRAENYEEAAGDHRSLVSGTDVVADQVATTDQAGAVWGDPLNVDGFDRLHMFLKHTAGVATTAIHIDMQCSTFKADPTVGEWFDCYEDVNLDGTQVAVAVAFDWTTGSTKVCFKIPRFGRWMRFRVWTDGSDRTDSRATLYASRVTESM